MADDTQSYMRLTAAFLPTFDRKPNPLTRKSFVRYASRIEQSSGRAHERLWPALKAGNPVPAYVMRDFIAYLGVVEPGAHDPEDVAVVCPPPRTSSSPGPKNSWRAGWSPWGNILGQYFNPPEDAYCLDPQDLTEAAAMVLVSVGTRENRALSAKAALEAGQRITGRSVDVYAELLLRFWRSNKHSVLFATRLDDAVCTRTGVSVLAPLTEECYRRFREGKVEDLDVRDVDLLPSSCHLMINAAADNRDLDLRSKADWSMGQFLTLIFQIASLCPSLVDGPGPPHLIGFAGNEESRKRLEAYSFKKLKAKTPRTGKTIMELTRPDAFDFKSFLFHNTVIGLIGAFQLGIRHSRPRNAP